MNKIELKTNKPNNSYITAYANAVKKGLKNQHIVPHSKGGWAIKTIQAEKPSRIFTTKKDAVAHGIEIARKYKTELFIHRKDGRIEDRRSYGAN